MFPRQVSCSIGTKHAPIRCYGKTTQPQQPCAQTGTPTRRRKKDRLRQTKLLRKRLRAMKPDWNDLTEKLIDRSQGYCEFCGAALGDTYARHHRKLRKHGGQHYVTNLLVLHHECHQRIHFNPTDSYKSGHLVSSTSDPTQIPVYIPGYGFVFAGTKYFSTQQSKKDPWIEQR